MRGGLAKRCAAKSVVHLRILVNWGGLRVGVTGSKKDHQADHVYGMEGWPEMDCFQACRIELSS